MVIAANEPTLSGPYDGDGITTVFDYDFKIYADAEITVVRENADATLTVLALGPDYAVTGVGETSGTIVLTAGDVLPTGARLYATPDIAASQLRRFSNQTTLYLTEVEDAYDKLTSLIRQARADISRTPKLGVLSGVTDPVLPDPEDGLVLVGRSDGRGWESGPSSAQIYGATAAAAAALVSETNAAASAALAAGFGVEAYGTVAAAIAETAVIPVGSLVTIAGSLFQVVASGGDVVGVANRYVDLTRLSAGSLSFWASQPQGTVTPPLGVANARLVADNTKTGANSAGNHLGVDGLRVADGVVATKFWFGGVVGTAFAWPQEMVKQVYEARGQVVVASGDTAYLPCDPTAGDDFQKMCYWAISNKGHANNGDFRVVIADGLHELDTFLDTYNDLYIAGRAAPEFIQIASAAFGVPDGDNVHTVTVNLSTPLPDRVVVNYALGMQNVKGNGGAEALNGALKVLTVAANRLSFTAKMRIYGQSATTFNIPDNTLTLGLAANQCVVPQSCLRVKSGTTGGWDGVAREGFINAFKGSVSLLNVGISYNGVTSPHDMFFARGGEILMLDRVVVSGAGAKVLRTGYAGRIFANRCFFGGVDTATQIYQGVAADGLSMIRCCFGSTSAEAISLTADTSCFGTACIGVGAPHIVRTTYGTSRAVFSGGSRFAYATDAWKLDQGKIEVTSLERVIACTTPLNIAGNGYFYGNPVIVSSTNPMPRGNFFINGGGWYEDDAKPLSNSLPAITASVTGGSMAAGLAVDRVVAYPDAKAGMAVVVRPAVALPAQNVSYVGYCWTDDEVVIRISNDQASATTATAKTLLINAMVLP